MGDHNTDEMVSVLSEGSLTSSSRVLWDPSGELRKGGILIKASYRGFREVMTPKVLWKGE